MNWKFDELQKGCHLLPQLKRTTLTLFICAACALACFAQQTGKTANELPPSLSGSAERDPKAWKLFSSSEGGFSVVLPAELKQRTQSLATIRGPAQMHLFEAETFAGYQVMYMSFRESLEEDAELVKQMLDDGRDGGVRNVNGQLLEETEIKLDGHAGRALKVRLTNGDIIRSRLYVAGHRLYVVSILTPDKDSSEPIVRFHEEVANKFLDSFKLTTKRAKVAATSSASNSSHPAFSNREE
jgi:hypothetical protein